MQSSPVRDEEPPGGLSPGRLDAVLTGVAKLAGFDAGDARLIKFTNSAVFDLPSAGVVVKVAGSKLVTDRIPRVLDVVRWLQSHDFPAVRPLEGIAQPVHSLGHAATVWVRVAPSGPAPTGQDLAHLVRRFHDLPAPAGLPAWAPTTGIRQRLAEADGLDDRDLAFLHDRCAEVEGEVAHLRPDLPLGPIHGDAFLGNLIPGPDGPVLCDFDSTSIGPREWDLTPIAVGSLRFDYADDPHPSFADTYGVDVTAWDGFETLRRLRELQLVTSVVPVLRGNTAVRAQFHHRLTSLKAGDSIRWQPYERAFGRT